MSPPPSFVLAVAVAFLSAAAAQAQKFLPDDPVAVDQDTLAVPKPKRVELSTTYDVLEHTFSHQSKGLPPPAANVNTLGEVPDSSWFTNRMGARLLSIEELVRGPDQLEGPDLSAGAAVIRGKSGGITPGFTIRDSRGDVYFIKTDPQRYPNLATAADVIGAKFFHAFGYFVSENYVAYVRRDQLKVDPQAKIKLLGAPRRPMTEADLDRILAGAFRRADGRVRMVASRALPGQPLGPHKYHGTRGDDANDVFPHEHRRDLRGYRVFCAWLNHDDSRSINSEDTYLGEEGAGHVRHHLIDFSSILGSGSDARREIAPQNPRAGNEYIVEAGPLAKTAVSLGLWERPWRKVKYWVHPEIGRLEADFFRPERWKPEYPNPAFERMRPADAFWAARIVSRFSDEMVRALAHAGQYTDPVAERYLADTLIKRRDKIVAHYFRQLNPLAEFHLAGEGEGATLEFSNLGEQAGLARVDGYEYQWFSFDNLQGSLTPVQEARQAATRSLSVPVLPHPYLMVRIRTRSAEPAWVKAVDVYVRGPGARRLVGIERQE